ncbi:hypothetical protein ACGFZP_37790 [Kitasatospora sp. NPDC048239]|uniref:hypothetical protein n=1 Tax=unclassified Kitasatospora TaxID=2633591 RepID=UPI0037136B28
MAILISTKDVVKPQHLFIPYRTADGTGALQIVHTGTLALDGGGGPLGDNVVVAFVPYGASGSVSPPTTGKVQDFSSVLTASTVTATLAGFRVTGDDNVTAFIDSSELHLRTQPGMTGISGPPLCLIMEVRIGALRTKISRIAYQATVKVEPDPGNEHSASLLQNIPNLIPAGSADGSMVDATHRDPIL